MNICDRWLRRVLALGLALCVVTTAHDARAAGESRLGFFGGLNLADMGGDMDRFGDQLAAEFEALGGAWSVDKSTRTGFGVGAYWHRRLTSAFGLQVEAQYIRRGVDFDLRGDVEGFAISGDLALALDYLEVPVLVRMTPWSNWARGLVFLAGPAIGINTGAELATKLQATGGQAAAESQDVKDSFRSTTLGAIFGLGVSGEIDRSTAFLLQARYYVGLTNAFDEPDFSSRSRDIGFFVALEFRLD